MELKTECFILVAVMKAFRGRRRCEYIEMNGTANICMCLVRFRDYVILAALMLSSK
jgi:hypothetical protein